MNRIVKKKTKKLIKYGNKKLLLTILLILTLIVIYFIPTKTISRMLEGFNDSANVYIGDYILNIDNFTTTNSFDVMPGKNAEYQFLIKNYIENYVSDVAMKYDLQVEFPIDISTVIGLKIIDDNNNEFLPIKGANNTYIFKDLGQISAINKEEKNYKIIFDFKSANSIIEITNIKLNVIASQLMVD